MDPAILKDTIIKFNQYCGAGEDPDFHRSPSALVPLDTPPYYALKMYPGGPNTQGGLKKNAKGQVLDPDGKVIPRLYAPGENGSYFGFLYTGGGNICENLVWGRITGENAVPNLQGLHKKASGILRTPEKPPNKPILTGHCGEKLGLVHRSGSNAVQNKKRFWTRVIFIQSATRPLFNFGLSSVCHKTG
jgi:hypothetical protein